MSSVSRPREQGTAWVPKLKNEPAYSILIISPPVYSHTAFLDDFFGRSFPYTQAEATPVLRTRGESSPLSPRDRSCVCSKSTCFIRRVPDPRRVRKESPRDERRREVMAASEQSVLL